MTVPTRLAVYAVMPLLSACLAHTPAPVSERSLVDGPPPDVYVVNKDDTLYSVAWRYELEFKELARLNGIEPPYVIQPGQRVVLTADGRQRQSSPVRRSPDAAKAPPPSRTSAPGQPAAPAANPVATAKPDNAPQAVPAAKPSIVTKPPAAVNPASATTPAQTPSGTPAKPAATKPVPPKPAPAAQPRPNVPATLGSGAWRPPVAAKPRRGFGGGSKGFDYALPAGTLVRAASSGVVVYAGPGLGGFRHLVIVKASERHLVAYGVNVKPVLKEGDSVKIGDTVARTGSSASAGQLHFEVRDRGKPIDPKSVIGA